MRLLRHGKSFEDEKKEKKKIKFPVALKSFVYYPSNLNCEL